MEREVKKHPEGKLLQERIKILVPHGFDQYDSKFCGLIKEAPPEAITLQACNETWFSNQLEWLLNPQSGHGLGTAFATKFLERIGRLRSSNHMNLRRRNAYLKWGKEGAGTGSTGFNLGNCAVFREFYLSRDISRQRNSGLYCDVVLADLDSKDSLFLVIENKLFTCDRLGQLGDYFNLVESKFTRAKVREYVYLTLLASPPSDISAHGDWVPMSWLVDIRSILKELLGGSVNCSPSKDVESTYQLLEWLYSIANKTGANMVSAEDVSNLLQLAAGQCLHEELCRLGEGKPGQWFFDEKSFLLKHTSRKSKLKIELLPGLTIAVQAHSARKAEFEKILIPFGAQPDQVFNLIDMAARDIYHLFFKDASRYLADRRRIRKKNTEQKARWFSLFEYINKNRYALSLSLNLVRSINKNP